MFAETLPRVRADDVGIYTGCTENAMRSKVLFVLGGTALALLSVMISVLLINTRESFRPDDQAKQDVDDALDALDRVRSFATEMARRFRSRLAHSVQNYAPAV